MGSNCGVITCVVILVVAILIAMIFGGIYICKPEWLGLGSSSDADDVDVKEDYRPAQNTSVTSNARPPPRRRPPVRQKWSESVWPTSKPVGADFRVGEKVYRCYKSGKHMCGIKPSTVIAVLGSGQFECRSARDGSTYTMEKS